MGTKVVDLENLKAELYIFTLAEVRDANEVRLEKAKLDLQVAYYPNETAYIDVLRNAVRLAKEQHATTKQRRDILRNMCRLNGVCWKCGGIRTCDCVEDKE